MVAAMVFATLLRPFHKLTKTQPILKQMLQLCPCMLNTQFDLAFVHCIKLDAYAKGNVNKSADAGCRKQAAGRLAIWLIS